MQELNRIHLNALRAVEACARHGGLAGAAAELGVTPGAVSQQVARAEAQLGRLVFERTARGLVLTEYGAALLPRLSEGFRFIEAALAGARRRDEAILTISVAPVLAAKWLVPRLSGFAARHPGIQLRLDATTTRVDLDTSDVDIALRVGPGNWPGVRAEKLLDQEVFPVCAPELASHIASPRDLVALPVVRDANSIIPWNLWLAPFGLDESQFRPGNSFTDAALALDAAIAGQGVLLAWQTLAHSALKAGTLVAPFPQRARTGDAYYAVTSLTRREDARTKAFKAWLREEIADTARDFEAADALA